MKIQSINNLSSVYCCAQKFKQQNKELSSESSKESVNWLVDYTNKRSLVNFRAKTPPINPAKLSLDEKLTSLFFTEMSEGDVVLIGKSLSEIQRGLMSSVKNFDTMLDRIFFIKDGGLSVPLAFNMTDVGAFTFVHNIGKKDILVARKSGVKTLEPGGKTFINEGDVIINNNRNIPISFLDNGIEFNVLEHVDKVFSFVPSKIDEIENFNSKVIDRIGDKELENEIKTEVPLKKKGITFSDIGGLDNVIKQLKKGIVYPIKKPYAFKNADLNHGFLFYGPPGTGKTLLGKAIANEIDANYYELNGLELEDSLVGSTEKKWRELFAQAKSNQPCVLFIDEFDAVAKQRNGKDVYGDKVVNQILTLITDVDTNNDQVFIIAATNMPERLDPAIVRPGRIGKHIEIPAPSKEGLYQIFDIHSRKQNLDAGLDKEALIEEFSRKKYTGADVRAIVTDALDKAWERLGIYEKMEDDTLTPDDIDNVKITQEDFRKALDNFEPISVKNKRNPIGFKKQ